MRRSVIVLASLLVLLLANSVFAGAPLPGAYDSVDLLGGLVLVGRYTEGFDATGSALEAGTVLNAESWDPGTTTLASQWRYWCAVEVADAIILVDLRDGNGNGNVTYQKTFIGGDIWLSGTGPWNNGDPDYPGTITSYIEFETVTYVNWVPISARTNVQASAQFDAYPDDCLTFYIGNGVRVADTDLGDAVPANYPGLLDTSCDATRTEGAFWDLNEIPLTIIVCTRPLKEATWGNVKSMYGD